MTLAVAERAPSPIMCSRHGGRVRGTTICYRKLAALYASKNPENDDRWSLRIPPSAWRRPSSKQPYPQGDAHSPPRAIRQYEDVHRAFSVTAAEVRQDFGEQRKRNEHEEREDAAHAHYVHPAGR